MSLVLMPSLNERQGVTTVIAAEKSRTPLTPRDPAGPLALAALSSSNPHDVAHLLSALGLNNEHY